MAIPKVSFVIHTQIQVHNTIVNTLTINFVISLLPKDRSWDWGKFAHMFNCISSYVETAVLTTLTLNVKLGWIECEYIANRQYIMAIT